MNLKQFKKEAMKNERFRKEYERFDLWFEIKHFALKMKLIIGQFLNKR